MYMQEANNEGDERPASECSSLQTDSGRGLSVESEQFDDDQEAERSHMIQWRQSFYQHSFWRERLRLDYHIDPRGEELTHTHTHTHAHMHAGTHPPTHTHTHTSVCSRILPTPTSHY